MCNVFFVFVFFVSMFVTGLLSTPCRSLSNPLSVPLSPCRPVSVSPSPSLLLCMLDMWSVWVWCVSLFVVVCCCVWLWCVAHTQDHGKHILIHVHVRVTLFALWPSTMVSWLFVSRSCLKHFPRLQDLLDLSKLSSLKSRKMFETTTRSKKPWNHCGRSKSNKSDADMYIKMKMNTDLECVRHTITTTTHNHTQPRTATHTTDSTTNALTHNIEQRLLVATTTRKTTLNRIFLQGSWPITLVHRARFLTDIAAPFLSVSLTLSLPCSRHSSP